MGKPLENGKPGELSKLCSRRSGFVKHEHCVETLKRGSSCAKNWWSVILNRRKQSDSLHPFKDSARVTAKPEVISRKADLRHYFRLATRPETHLYASQNSVCARIVDRVALLSEPDLCLGKQKNRGEKGRTDVCFAPKGGAKK